MSRVILHAFSKHHKTVHGVIVLVVEVNVVKEAVEQCLKFNSL